MHFDTSVNVRGDHRAFHFSARYVKERIHSAAASGKRIATSFEGRVLGKSPIFKAVPFGIIIGIVETVAPTTTRIDKRLLRAGDLHTSSLRACGWSAQGATSTCRRTTVS